jgi:hypothetical protein
MRIPPASKLERILRRGDRPWLGAAVLLLAAALLGLWQLPQRINHDCAFGLQQAQMLLDGGVPYCDFIDANPPLIVYLNVPPAALARYLGGSPIVVFHLSVLLLLVISGVEIYGLLRQPAMRLWAAERGLLLLAWVGSYFLVDWYGFAGQREHLFMLFYVPYLFLRILRHRGGSLNAWLAAALGAQAGVGASLKPHFLLVALGVEIVLLLATRRGAVLVRSENIALAGVVAAYVLHWLFVPAAMREAFFGRWLPAVCRGYGAYDASTWQMIRLVLESPISFAELVVILLAVARGARRQERLRHCLLALAALAGMTLLMAFVQHKGWRYHRIPLDIAALLCLAVLASTRDRASAFSLQRFRAGSAFAVGTIGLFVAIWFALRTDRAAAVPSFAALRQVVENHTHPGDRVLVVATSVYPAYPTLLQTGRRTGSRYAWSFPIAFCYAGCRTEGAERPVYRRRQEAPAEEQRFLRELEDDVHRLRPQLMIVHDGAGWAGLPAGFNTFDYLVYSGWTKGALVGYRELPGPQGWKVFVRRQ